MEVVDSEATAESEPTSVIASGFRDVEEGTSDAMPFYRHRLFHAGVATGTTLTTVVAIIIWHLAA